MTEQVAQAPFTSSYIKTQRQLGASQSILPNQDALSNLHFESYLHILRNMQPKSPSIQECPVGRAVETVGEWWSILILRDAFQGATKFDEFSQSLGIAPNILSRRLAHLTASGMFVRRRYSERPPRYEYVLTDKARDFFPVIVALLAWGNKHLAPKGESILLANRIDARPFDPVVVDAADMRPITLENAVVIAGPRASRGMRARLASLKAMNPAVVPAGD